jgi:SAM-dependent methyltransferase
MRPTRSGGWQTAEVTGGYDPTTYGRSFADVYDDWYPADGTVDAVVARVRRLAGDGGSVLELGVGTGRLALPLAAAGLRVTGLDASEEMLDVLAAKDLDDLVRRSLGDVGRPADWPDGPFDVVLAACNLLCNLADARVQARCVATAAGRLRPGGALVVEAFVPAPLEVGARLTATEVRADAVILIASSADPATGVVTAQHVELRDGEPVRLRPWVIRVVQPDELDRWAADAGLVLEHRGPGWGDGTGASAEDGSVAVSIYRAPLTA